MAFRYKTANLWLPHFSSRPFPRLFSSELDDALIDDYRRYLPRAREAGFDNLLIFGLIGEGGANQMPADLDVGFSPARDRAIRRLIDLIHENGLRFLAGLGVYSWGFAHIIAAHPEIAGKAYDFRGLGSGWRGDFVNHNNAGLQDLYDRLDSGLVSGAPTAPAWGASTNDVLCASREEAWEWQERVIRFMLERYDLDGFELESADMGRCFCPDCRQIENITYHARLNARVTAFVRRIAPDKMVVVNNSGMRFDGAMDNAAIAQMAGGADYLVDCYNGHLVVMDNMSGPNRVLLNDRPEVVRAVAPAAYGSFAHLRDAGMERTQWFSPAARSLVQVIGDAYRDGCRAFVYYALGAFNNAGHELNNYVCGYAMDHPEADWREVVAAVVDRLYRPTSPAARDGLVELFGAVEMSCFYNNVTLNMRHVTPETPVPYLVNANAFMQARHHLALERHLAEARKLVREAGDVERAHTLLACLEGTVAVVGSSVKRLLAGG